NNALKFTDTGKIVYGCSKKDFNTLLFYVSDTGIGISNKNKDEIFAPFRQVNDSLSRKYDGVGLGLSICKGLIELMGGSIWFESKVGVGTTFYFTLPFKRANLLTNDILIPAQLEFDWKNKKILIVEDDQFNSQYITKILEKTKVNFFSASDGKSALKLIDENSNLDLILMDILLPDVSGLELTRLIRNFNSKIIIIAQTAFASKEDEKKSLEAGCNNFIPKPINPQNLLQMMNIYLNK
ncbi:MAG: response regulator, partial [Bacteroidetes bacterium]|nr:response regulator [Bacteroidota bacterium]